jgi:hypothetical protein
LPTFLTFFILMMVASCRNKYYGTNFISAVHTSLLIAPGFRTIQFLFITRCDFVAYGQGMQKTFQRFFM